MAGLLMLNRAAIRAAFGTSSLSGSTRLGYISVTVALRPVMFKQPDNRRHAACHCAARGSRQYSCVLGRRRRGAVRSARALYPMRAGKWTLEVSGANSAVDRALPGA